MEDFSIEIRKSSLQKTPEEKEVILFANKISNCLLIECGIRPIDIGEEKIFILPKDFKKRITGSNGAGRADKTTGFIFLNSEKVRGKGMLRFGNIVFHEMLHLKSLSSDKFFGGLNEAIISHYERYFVSKALKDNFFSKEKIWLESKEAKSFKREISRSMNIRQNDLYTVDKNKNFDVHCYPLHEMVLERIVNKTYLDNIKRFDSVEDVIKEFLKLMINGNLAGVLKILNKSYKPEFIELLKNMNEKPESAEKILEYLSLKNQ